MIVTCRDCGDEVIMTLQTFKEHGEICFECWNKEVDRVFGK